MAFKRGMPDPSAEIQQYKILIVEDVSGVLDVLEEKFAQGGFEVYRARDGEEGLDQALDCLPDVVLSDILMPRMDGIEMAKRLLAQKATGSCPIVFLSVLSEQEYGEALRGLDGKYHFLWKNECSLEDVVAKVSEVLASGKL